MLADSILTTIATVKNTNFDLHYREQPSIDQASNDQYSRAQRSETRANESVASNGQASERAAKKISDSRVFAASGRRSRIRDARPSCRRHRRRPDRHDAPLYHRPRRVDVVISLVAPVSTLNDNERRATLDVAHIDGRRVSTANEKRRSSFYSCLLSRECNYRLHERRCEHSSDRCVTTIINDHGAISWQAAGSEQRTIVKKTHLDVSFVGASNKKTRPDSRGNHRSARRRLLRRQRRWQSTDDRRRCEAHARPLQSTARPVRTATAAAALLGVTIVRAHDQSSDDHDEQPKPVACRRSRRCCSAAFTSAGCARREERANVPTANLDHSAHVLITLSCKEA